MRLCDDGAARRPADGRHVARRVDLGARTGSRATWATTGPSSSTTIPSSFITRSPTRPPTCGAAWSARPTISPTRAAGRRDHARSRRWQLRPLGGLGAGGLPAGETPLVRSAWSASAVRFVPDFRPAVVETDMFTPTTIQRFTGHDEGAVYGAAEKRYDGTTHLKTSSSAATTRAWWASSAPSSAASASPTGYLLKRMKEEG